MFVLLWSKSSTNFGNMPFKEYSYSKEILYAFKKGAMWLSKDLQNVQYFFFNSRVLLETMQSKRFAVNKYYMPMQRLH
jgi:hypothetical protein